LLMPLAQIIPSIFLLEVAASINLVPGIWREIHWPSLAGLTGGYVLGLPIGIMALAGVPAPYMQVGLGFLVIAIATVMLRGFRLARMPGRAPTAGTGVVSGVLNGAFGIGGPPVIIFYFSTPEATSMARASIIFFFLASDLIGLGFLAHEGLVTRISFIQFAVWLPALILGITIGARSFKRTSPVQFRQYVLILVIGLACFAIMNAVSEIF